MYHLGRNAWQVVTKRTAIRFHDLKDAIEGHTTRCLPGHVAEPMPRISLWDGTKSRVKYVRCSYDRRAGLPRRAAVLTRLLASVRSNFLSACPLGYFIYISLAPRGSMKYSRTYGTLRGFSALSISRRLLQQYAVTCCGKALEIKK